MWTSAYDVVMTKLMAMEKGLAKLDKLDKLDDIERNVASMNAKLCSLETRLSTNEKLTRELKDSVTFISEQYDSVLKLMKGKALRKHSLHEKTAASVLLKPFISSFKM